ncbi:MAG: MFS transporter [Firmicutes bacterium]|nr:MFS transporter [Bacillota bacterium]
MTASFRALRHPNYRIIFTAQLISMVGTWMQIVAQGWLVYRLTHNPAMLGLVTFASQGPAFLLTGFGGAVADRMDARKLALLSQSTLLLQAALLGILTVTHHVGVHQVLLLAVLMGVATAFDTPTFQVLVARSVPREDLPNAIALNSGIFHSSRILGPALAGVVVAAFGEGWCFLLNALSYVAVLVGLSFLRLPPKPHAAEKQSMKQELLEGLRYVNGSPAIRRGLALAGLITFLAMPYTVLMPAVVRDNLRLGARELGWIMGVGGVGATLGALRLALQKDARRLPRNLLMALGGVMIFLPLFAASRWLWLSMLLIVPLGFSMVSANTSNNTLVQLAVPDHLRGRIMAIYATVFMAGLPLGALATGFLARHIGISWALSLGALGCGLVIVAFGRGWKRQETATPPGSAV